MASHGVVRDFIYMDVDRLYSLASQMFEGVTQLIVESQRDEAKSRAQQSGPPLSGSSTAEEFAETSYATRSKVLHDHLYNQLESRLQPDIIAPDPVTGALPEGIAGKPAIVKVSGRAEIHDYKRLHYLTENFNKIGEAIAYAQMTALLGGADASQIVQLAQTEKDPEQKRVLRGIAEKLKNPAQVARDMGLRQDEKVLSNLRLFTDLFYPCGCEITVLPSLGAGTVFRGVIEERWLRLDREYLRSLYGGFADFTWTMVGQITYVPGGSIPPPPTTSDSPENNESNVEEEASDTTPTALPVQDSPGPSMRDPFRSMFHYAISLERMFFASSERVEILMRPLAIYQEMPLSSSG